MSSEKTPSGEPERDVSCQPSRRWIIIGVIATVVLVALYFPLRRLLSGGMLERPDEALINIIDVFRCCILTWKAATIMLPAFLLGGAIAAFAPPGLILKYLGPRSNQLRAYPTAALAGVMLSLCSCNIVPLFVSIYRRGAGIGPAFTFLFAGPAINIVAAVFTFQVIGWRLGIWRVIGVPFIGIAIGLVMALVYRRETQRQQAEQAAMPLDEEGMGARLWALFGLLLAMVVYGAWQSDLVFPPPGSDHPPTSWVPLAVGLGLLTAALVALAGRAFDRDEVEQWLLESWGLVKLVVPVLLPAVLVIGALATYIDVKLVYQWVGAVPEGSGLWAHFRPILVGATFGELMYFPILTEVAFTKAFLKLGMDVGPALALLIAGPGSSIAGFVIIARVIGWGKAALYEGLLILFTAIYAAIFASQIGAYICSCMLN